jgi:hypothetical protein
LDVKKKYNKLCDIKNTIIHPNKKIRRDGKKERMVGREK